MQFLGQAVPVLQFLNVKQESQAKEINLNNINDEVTEVSNDSNTVEKLSHDQSEKNKENYD